WDVIKAQEKQRESVLDGIPAGLPALARTQKMLSRAERAGIDVATDAMAERIEREQVSGEPAGTEQVSREQITREQTGLARTSPAPAGGARPGTESAGPAHWVTGPRPRRPAAARRVRDRRRAGLYRPGRAHRPRPLPAGAPSPGRRRGRRSSAARPCPRTGRADPYR